MLKKVKLSKILNNNVILVFDVDAQQEAVFYSKGIGFGKKEGQFYQLETQKIEKSFITHDDDHREYLLKLVSGIDHTIFELCLDIVDMAEKDLGPLNPRLRLVLTDHIIFTLERIKTNQLVFNPFVDEIKLFYPKEYQVADLARKSIFDKLNVDLSEDEIGFIAMHFYAARKNIEVKESVRDMRLINEMVQIIEKSLNIQIDHSFEYSRLVYHLKAAIDRITEHKTIKNPLLEVLKKELKSSYETAERLKDYLMLNGFKEVPEDELGYMAIHINRFI